LSRYQRAARSTSDATGEPHVWSARQFCTAPDRLLRKAAAAGAPKGYRRHCGSARGGKRGMCASSFFRTRARQILWPAAI
jgi:hypothetical protein